MTDGWYFASLLGWALAWMALVRPLRLGQALLCAVCGMLLTAYLGVIVLPLRQVTAYFLMAGGLAALAVGLVLLLLDKRQLRQRVLRPSLLIWLLLHCARAASGFAQSDAPLTVLDPMCGKGTTLFCALEEGDHAVGMDVDAKALLEADQLLGRSLKMNRLKHKREESSLTVPKGKPVRSVGYRLSTSIEGWKNGDERTFRLLNGDLGVLPAVMARESCHLAVADLPYGVQHAPSEGRKVMSLANFASKVCESCFAVLKHGGAIALSFNTYTLARDSVLQAMEGAGFIPQNEAPYNGFAHWVEQAVDRDAVLAVKP